MANKPRVALPPARGALPGPGPNGPRLVDGRGVLSRVLVCLAVALGLTTQHLVDFAQHRPFGPQRSTLIALSDPLHEGAHSLGLDRPDHLLQRVRDRGVKPTSQMAASQNDLQELAAGAGGLSPPMTLGPPAPPPTPVSSGPPVTLGPSYPSLTTVPAKPAPLGPATPSPRRVVDGSQRLRLWAGGDSMGEYIGNQLLSTLSDRDRSDVELDYRISTGLARPDYFDWPGPTTSTGRPRSRPS